MRWLLLSLLLAFGCGKAAVSHTKQIIPLDQVPENVMKAARAKLPTLKFDAALKTPDGVYEIRGKAKSGKIQEVEVSEAGEILAVE